MKIAIIPARGGSKRIPRKNIKLFCGKPIIAWSIQAAINSKCFDKVIVSTDDLEIAEIAGSFGAEIPFMRPENLSDDQTTTIPVINHAIKWLQEQGIHPKLACCIYATAPFVLPEDIINGLKRLQKNKDDFAFTVTSYAFPIQRAININSDNLISMFSPEEFSTRSQDLKKAYHDAGQFYWGKTEAWLEERMVFGPRSTPIIIPRHRVQDIDTHEDWVRAEWLFKAMEVEKN